MLDPLNDEQALAELTRGNPPALAATLRGIYRHEREHLGRSPAEALRSTRKALSRAPRVAVAHTCLWLLCWGWLILPLHLLSHLLGFTWWTLHGVVRGLQWCDGCLQDGIQGLTRRTQRPLAKVVLWLAGDRDLLGFNSDA